MAKVIDTRGGSIEWDEGDRRTVTAIERLGGSKRVQEAVADAMPGRQVEIRAITEGISGAAVFRAWPKRVHGAREVVQVLKIGPARLLGREVENYKKYVEHRIEQNASFASLEAQTILEEAAESRPHDLSVLSYRSAGDISLGDYVVRWIERGDVARACDAIDDLLQVLRIWHEDAQPIRTVLTANGMFGFGPDALPKFEAWCSELHGEWKLPGVDGVLRFWADGALSSQRTMCSPLHGDLHQENVRVDGRTVILIDFGSCEDGHFLRDLVTLEAHLLIRGLCPEGSLGIEHQAFWQRIQSFYDPRLLYDPSRPVTADPYFAVLVRLRRYAHLCLMKADRRLSAQYAFGVLRHAIRHVNREDLDEGQRWFAARLACHLAEVLMIRDGEVAFAEEDTLRDASRELCALDYPEGRWNDIGTTQVPVLLSSDWSTWVRLAKALLGADQLDIVGVVPTPLMAALLELAQMRVADAPPVRVRCTMPPRPGGQTTYFATTRWEGAGTAVRNLAAMLGGGMSPMSSMVRFSLVVNDDCLIRAQWPHGEVRVFSVPRVLRPYDDSRAPYFLAEIADTRGSVSQSIGDIFSPADFIEIREIECHRDDVDFHAPAENWSLVIENLARYGEGVQKPALRPIALVIPTISRPSGDEVLMFKRHPLIDTDDFGLLSFPSARVRSEDIASLANRKIPSNLTEDDELDMLWNECEEPPRPRPFRLRREVFTTAARRALYKCTELDLLPERFQYHGLHVIEVGDAGQQYGYAVMSVALRASELSAARLASRRMVDGTVDLLKTVSVDALLIGEMKTNRFTQLRRDWLSTEVFGR